MMVLTILYDFEIFYVFDQKLKISDPASNYSDLYDFEKKGFQIISNGNAWQYTLKNHDFDQFPRF